MKAKIRLANKYRGARPMMSSYFGDGMLACFGTHRKRLLFNDKRKIKRMVRRLTNSKFKQEFMVQ